MSRFAPLYRAYAALRPYRPLLSLALLAAALFATALGSAAPECFPPDPTCG